MTNAADYRTASGRLFDPDAYAMLVRPLTSEEGGGWLATVPDLPGCMGDGETPAEALADVRDAMLEWADASHEHGDPIPDPNFVTTQTEAAE